MSLVALVLTALYVLLNVNGFSFSRLHFLSDEALLAMVVADRVKDDHDNQRSEIQYPSSEDFLRRNTDCCTVKGGLVKAPDIANKGDWLNWLWHRREVYGCYQRHNTSEPRYYEFYSYLDNEGTNLDTYGMEMTRCPERFSR